ncbi:hypothetical protein PVAP13_2KG137316 [Panicum virgatum]|uniref:Uncharacterized protein n=1 Tax=Panicum virgatum TaxID=38727 RepID=A0A8T0W8M8_PANVG|nr:hypothetical protein PVAP13_2KG137316 [Panicum virgatum]
MFIIITTNLIKAKSLSKEGSEQIVHPARPNPPQTARPPARSLPPPRPSSKFQHASIQIRPPPRPSPPSCSRRPAAPAVHARPRRRAAEIRRRPRPLVSGPYPPLDALDLRLRPRGNLGSGSCSAAWERKLRSRGDAR